MHVPSDRFKETVIEAIIRNPTHLFMWNSSLLHPHSVSNVKVSVQCGIGHKVWVIRSEGHRN